MENTCVADRFLLVQQLGAMARAKPLTEEEKKAVVVEKDGERYHVFFKTTRTNKLAPHIIFRHPSDLEIEPGDPDIQEIVTLAREQLSRQVQ